MTAVDDPSRSAKNRSRIRDILRREWDPIRVRNIPGVHEDEYDRYIEGICALLADPHRSKEQIAAYLVDIQSRKMLLRCRRGTAESGCRLFVDGRPGSVEQMSQPRSSDFGSRGEG